ncbi:MAG: Asp23/Gls24 family envelope stress response protein [Syntrophomonadaceae bacterium]|nr:Asp23/Gls24 family envelope stress response protein [Syntrophomonadaceae bacterium]
MVENKVITERIDDSNDLGSIRIADEVVSIIAGLAAVEVEGVAAMSGGWGTGIVEMLGRKNLGKGVKVEVGEKEAAIDVFLLVEFGFPIPKVAQTVQEQVKSAVETMTGLRVTSINVHVVGVSMKKAEKEEMIEV